MPRHEFTYDKKSKETPEWKSLYGKWRYLLKRPHSAEFNEFLNFYQWSIANGFELGARLDLLCDSEPYSPDNCQWMPPADKQCINREGVPELIDLWNNTVNRIRRHYGMELIGQKGDQA